MTFKKSLFVAAVASTLLSACSKEKVAQHDSKQTIAAATVSKITKKTASKQANQLFDTMFKQGVDRNPMRQTYLGIKKDYDKWHDLSEENAASELAIAKENLALIQTVDVTTLDAQTQISHKLFVQNLENHIADYKWPKSSTKIISKVIH